MASVESYYRVSNLVSTPGGHIEQRAEVRRSLRVQQPALIATHSSFRAPGTMGRRRRQRLSASWTSYGTKYSPSRTSICTTISKRWKSRCTYSAC